MEVTSKSVFSNFIWRFLERWGAQLISFVVSIILARILEPTVYGTVALIFVFTAILQVFVDSGFGTALIQKKDADDKDFSTVFFFNIFVCTILYIILFFFAPLIAKFYGSTQLTPYIRVVGLVLIIAGVKGIQVSYVTKKMQFKKFFFSTLGGTIVAAFVGIFMAYKGYGVWALIAQNLVNQIIDTIILWITVEWKPSFYFSFKRLKSLFKFGSKILIASLIDTTYSELRTLVIGKKYSADDLAYYNKGNQFPSLAVNNTSSAFNSVLFPSMSIEQDKKENVKAITKRAIKTSSYILSPLLIGLAACSTAFISLLLTDKWLPAVPFMIIGCFSGLMNPMNAANLNAIRSIGRSDITLKLEIIKKILDACIIAITMWFGVLWIALGSIIGVFCAQILDAVPNKKLINYGYFEQLKDLLPSFLLSLFMGVVVYCVNFLGLSNWLTLLIQVPLGIVIYVGFSLIFKFESFKYCLNMIKSIFSKNKKVKNNNEIEKTSVQE
ncbi:MAG: lipopolysaccharide biosynthesis protein [Clostridia bacterium]|nr:lipopolysaccharide biosynthesis protein [Clostridia bacterium]